MRVFISWSGDTSYQIAKDIHEWIGITLQKVEPFISSKDIRKGQRWLVEISKELEDCSFGIICLTKANLNSPWILFEAGAITKSIDTSNLSAILFDGLKPEDIEGPLAQFQHTQPSKNEMWDLIKSINQNLDREKLSDELLKKAFDLSWPALKNKFDNYNFEPKADGFKERSERNILTEVLELVRSFALGYQGDCNFHPFNTSIQNYPKVLECPLGGDYNHPISVSIYPVVSETKEKLQKIFVSEDGVFISDINSPIDTRGVIITIVFLNEENSRKWQLELTFHKGETLYEVSILEPVDMSNELPNVIWRN